MSLAAAGLLDDPEQTRTAISLAFAALARTKVAI